MKPVTQYTKSGRINIAYQVFGAGSIDLVYIPGWVSNIDLMWQCPELVDFLLELGKICRVILFDKRGTGLSDRVVELSTLEERMDDIRAVMDAIGSKQAILFGHSEGGCVSALFAATYPERVHALITFGVFAKRRYSKEYPWAPTDEERQHIYDMIENNWGSGSMNLESLAPSKAHDTEFMDWLARYFRSGASPSAAMVLTKMNTQVDIVDILDTIHVPTLIMQRTNDIDVKIEEGKFISEHIHNSKFVEFNGNDHLFWVGNTHEVLLEMKAFIADLKPMENHEERLYTYVSANIYTTANIDTTKSIITAIVGQYRGKLIQYQTNSFIAIFEGPSKAVHCCLQLMDSLNSQNVKISVGIHIKEGSVNSAHYVHDSTRKLLGTILEVAKPNQILITQTVRHLLSGAGLKFIQSKSIFETSLSEPHVLFSVTDHLVTASVSDGQVMSHTQNDSFLENVLQQIDEHLSNGLFGVDMLCKELGVSERQLQRKLKAISNKSPNQLISSVRLHRAKELLLGGQLNIAEIAYRTGFASPSYFSKSFRKEFGTTPSKFLINQQPTI